MARIYVVDDDHEMAYATKRILVIQGYEVIVFFDARLAIEEAKRLKPDLILMDMMMPQFSGAEAVKEIRNNSDLSKIPIIILTGLVSPEESLEMIRVAIDGKVYKTLGKPFKNDELVKAVKESLRWAPLI